MHGISSFKLDALHTVCCVLENKRSNAFEGKSPEVVPFAKPPRTTVRSKFQFHSSDEISVYVSRTMLYERGLVMAQPVDV